MKMMIAYSYLDKVEVTELNEFKHKPFFDSKKFYKICIYDFHYVNSIKEERDYKRFIKNLPLKKLKTLNL